MTTDSHENTRFTRINLFGLNLSLDVCPAFFRCSSLAIDSLASQVYYRPRRIHAYNVHHGLRRIDPFLPARYRSVNVDFHFASRFLPNKVNVQLHTLLNQLNADAEPDIKEQLDQTVILIHGKGQGLPEHKHGITQASRAISYCVRITDEPVLQSPVFYIGRSEYTVFKNKSEIVTRFELNTRDVEHSVWVDPYDTNLYMWYVRDGIVPHENMEERVQVTRYPNAVR